MCLHVHVMYMYGCRGQDVTRSNRTNTSLISTSRCRSRKNIDMDVLALRKAKDGQKDGLPILAKMARQFLGRPASSAGALSVNVLEGGQAPWRRQTAPRGWDPRALPLLIRSCVLSHPYCYSVLAEDGVSVFGEHGFGASRYLLYCASRGARSSRDLTQFQVRNFPRN